MNDFFNTLPLWVALVPLGLYLLALSCLHVRHRPFVISGAWDGVCLGISVAGLAIVGPLALVQPAAGRSLWSWPMLLVLLSLIVAICLLVSRPRLIIYNITVEQLRPLVAEVVGSLDPAARWAGESVALPTRGLQVHLDGNGSMRTVNIVAVGERASSENWSEFCRRLRRATVQLRVRSSPWAPAFALAAVAVLLSAGWFAVQPLFGINLIQSPPSATTPGNSDAGLRRSVRT